MDVRSLVGPQEIADRLEMSLAAIRQWRARDLLPPPLRVISGTPVWDKLDIDQWARDSGRLA